VGWNLDSEGAELDQGVGILTALKIDIDADERLRIRRFAMLWYGGWSFLSRLR